MSYFAHPTAIIELGATIGDYTKIWHFSHIMPGAIIGMNCNLGQSVYVDINAEIGNNCKLQNNVNVYEGVVLEDYVFCGPSMTFTNVKTPRCLHPRARGGEGYYKTQVKYGASLGAHVTVVCGVIIGRHAMIGSGSVVTEDVLNYALMVGNPARQIGWACECGEKLRHLLHCESCDKNYELKEFGLLEVTK